MRRAFAARARYRDMPSRCFASSRKAIIGGRRPGCSPAGRERCQGDHGSRSVLRLRSLLDRGAGDPRRVAARLRKGLSAPEAATAVLRDNLFGLEIDGRCVQIAAFAVALAAWRLGGWQCFAFAAYRLGRCTAAPAQGGVRSTRQRRRELARAFGAIARSVPAGATARQPDRIDRRRSGRSHPHQPYRTKHRGAG